MLKSLKHNIFLQFLLVGTLLFLFLILVTNHTFMCHLLNYVCSSLNDNFTGKFSVA